MVNCASTMLSTFRRMITKGYLGRLSLNEMISSTRGLVPDLEKPGLSGLTSKFLASYSCCTIRARENLIHPLYLTQYLDSIITRRQANLDTQSIAVPDLGLAKIEAFLVPVPSLEKQKHFVSVAEATDVHIAKMKAALGSANDLFNALVQRAFRGEV